MERRQKDSSNRPNPWHQKRGGIGVGDGRGGSSSGSSKNGGGKGSTSKRSGPGRAVASPSLDGGQNFESKSNSKFDEARLKMEAAVKKHMVQNYESSDEEDDIQVDPIVGSVLQSYAAIGGSNVDLGRTQHYLEELFQSGAATCLICIGSVKRIDPVRALLAQRLFVCPAFVGKNCLNHSDAVKSLGHVAMNVGLFCHVEVIVVLLPVILVIANLAQEQVNRNVPVVFKNNFALVLLLSGTVTRSAVCGKKLPCTYHNCEKTCHSGLCGLCPLGQNRTCPCGKRTYMLPCTEDIPPCGDTCGRMLNCGIHACPERCHRDKCGTCLEVTIKQCRCGLHKKELPCAKEFLCETKCKRSKDCGRHPCNRKCCDTHCPPCEKLCGRTLTCGQHKCESVCHRGPCYPCPLTASVSCNCGGTVINVPCGRQRRTRAPRCNKLCLNPPECHHERRENHSCHFGHCPPCNQVCNLQYTSCGHKCSKPCHSAVWVKVQQQAPAGPWELAAPQLVLRNLPCPPCTEPINVVCLGSHDKSMMPCHAAKSMSCGKRCGQPLNCGNHFCGLECHPINESCETCESPCELPRPAGCPHECRLPCHPAPCPPCRTTLRPRCHCGVTQLFIKCGDWTQPNVDQIAMMSCGSPCPKSFPCGHKCTSLCHAGDCPDSEKCSKKTKVYCSCRRIKKEVRCDVARSSEFSLPCDETCEVQKSEKEKMQAEEAKRRRTKEEEEARMEAERFQKKIEGSGRRKNRGRNHCDVAETNNQRTVLYSIITAIVAVFLALVYFLWT
ncbi:NF-X1-type zinc finger protein NFXL1 [Frankliniella fusca]|uniref:NF-X1-type zinc finger protein NFXL1 n=1 Tax=Frankliniella fusca TaxID=407009 RepID=A0AAE1H3B1_9NEOP|nr:NF-X1-type zinc finger protein NFXL1 [Frankliniella fusca]